MTQPAPSSKDSAGVPASASLRVPASAAGLPGVRVVILATGLVICAALLEAMLRERIGAWTGSTLVVVAVVSPLVTRRGDRSLPAMMPPLAFLAATLIAGQLLLPLTGEPLRTREAVMIMTTLGANAAWIVAATIASTTVAAIRHLTDR